MSLRRLAMLEPVYRLAPDLIRSGRIKPPPPADTAAFRKARMTDFRLLCRGGFYHAVVRYGPDLWTPFTYAGLRATELALRRKEQHRFWGVDCYSHNVVKDVCPLQVAAQAIRVEEFQGIRRHPTAAEVSSRSEFHFRLLPLTPSPSRYWAAY